MADEQCPFCEIAKEDLDGRVIEQNDHAFLIEDGFPLTPGHSLIIPRRHVGSFFETTEEEKVSLLQLLNKAKAIVDQRNQPSSYNIGINDGPAAGQTIPHLHIHLIPRYDEAGSDPRGGVRWIIPENADYWSNS